MNNTHNMRKNGDKHKNVCELSIMWRWNTTNCTFFMMYKVPTLCHV